LSLLLQQFETPHAAIHALADTLLKLSANGHITEAVQAYEEAEHTTLASLIKLFKSTEILVTELQRRVAIIVSSEGERCALGVDGIIEIANISSNNIRKSSKIDLRNPRNHATSGVLILNNQQIVPILDWQSLAGTIPSDETNSQTL
jgi:chemotaxis signal transduction protein